MLSDTPVTITICLEPALVFTRPMIKTGSRLRIWRGSLSSLVFHSSFMFLTLVVDRIVSFFCHAARSISPPSVSQSANLPLCAYGGKLKKLKQARVASAPAVNVFCVTRILPSNCCKQRLATTERA
jgi:hypothetical protein